MATDIYLSKEVHEQYSFNLWYDCEAGVGSNDLIHDPCNTEIMELDSNVSHWDVMEAMSKHNRECPAGKSKRLAPPPGMSLHVPESEIRRG